MPTDFDWKTWKKKQYEPEPPPPPEEPKFVQYLTVAANILMLVVVSLIIFSWWLFTTDADYTWKVISHCSDQKGVAVRTMRGDTVCVREDALTEVLGKSTNHVK